MADARLLNTPVRGSRGTTHENEAVEEPTRTDSAPNPELPRHYLDDHMRSDRREPQTATTAEVAWGRVPMALRLLAAVPLSMLPENYRRRIGQAQIPYTLGTAISGVLNTLFAIIFGYASFIAYATVHAQTASQAVGQMATHSNVMPGDGMMMTIGFTILLGFVFATPQGICLFLLFTESLFRVAASSAGEACGSLFVAAPLAVADKFIKKRVQAHFEAVPDAVSSDGQNMGLSVRTCIARPWDRRTTLSFRGRHYRVSGYRADEVGTRRHHYSLDIIPGWWTIDPEHLVEYEPELVIQ
ncbi:MAG: hypothetical protein KC561_18215, partial [Myxococcales bacterium]|nr:hypothetical protein [Myxococcales bacterium]